MFVRDLIESFYIKCSFSIHVLDNEFFVELEEFKQHLVKGTPYLSYSLPCKHVTAIIVFCITSKMNENLINLQCLLYFLKKLVVEFLWKNCWRELPFDIVPSCHSIIQDHIDWPKLLNLII